MKKLYIPGLALLLSLGPLTVTADDFDGSKPFLCATAEVVECVPVAGCQRVSADAINAPRFIKVDLGNKSMSARFAGRERSSNIERHESVDNKLMLQGVEDGLETERDGIGWTLSVAQDRGDMVLTGSGDNVGFVIFGSCTHL
jgi:hypothetical protein